VHSNEAFCPDQGNTKIFFGGLRRDVAILFPNTEMKVFMRWKDFLGRYVMHCHNVVHEDHSMMIRWDIVPPGKGFDTRRPAAEGNGKGRNAIYGGSAYPQGLGSSRRESCPGCEHLNSELGKRPR
jgi:hypothetical protein